MHGHNQQGWLAPGKCAASGLGEHMWLDAWLWGPHTKIKHIPTWAAEGGGQSQQQLPHMPPCHGCCLKIQTYAGCRGTRVKQGNWTKHLLVCAGLSRGRLTCTTCLLYQGYGGSVDGLVTTQNPAYHALARQY